VPHNTENVVDKIRGFVGKCQHEHHACSDPRKALYADDAALVILLLCLDARKTTLRVFAFNLAEELCAEYA